MMPLFTLQKGTSGKGTGMSKGIEGDKGAQGRLGVHGGHLEVNFRAKFERVLKN